MRRLLSLAVLLLALAPAQAADAPKPNTLTPKEISDGWLLLFDGETTFGWKIDGEAKVKDGELILGGDKETTATLTTQFGECDVHLQYFTDDPEKVKLGFAANHAGTVPIDIIRDHKNQWIQGDFQMAKQKGFAGSFKDPVKKAGLSGFAVGGPGNLEVLSWVKVQVPKGNQFRLRDLKLKPSGSKPIFNGKNLDGWKKFDADPKKAISEFTVKEGVIHLKNGPGDLQTEGQWADFVLQLECISNGKALNSGVFFRCLPGEYQQGYEAQIHNGFTEQPTKEYAIEDYDPETHKLTATRKEKYSAIDYGTGAIYRRIPARKQMAKDNEWFGMTVVAQGRHIAVWVNGVQVTDWTDNRPVESNARKGCKLEKGNLSLQGHDPTTDLRFRNFRLAELPQAKKEDK